MPAGLLANEGGAPVLRPVVGDDRLRRCHRLGGDGVEQPDDAADVVTQGNDDGGRARSSGQIVQCTIAAGVTRVNRTGVALLTTGEVAAVAAIAPLLLLPSPTRILAA